MRVGQVIPGQSCMTPNQPAYHPERESLLEIKGIGRETADAILLYVFDKPEMVADAYTRRFFSRVGLVPNSSNYGFVKTFLETNLPIDTALYRSFHALIVQLCKRVCKKRPECSQCVLNEICGKRVTDCG